MRYDASSFERVHRAACRARGRWGVTLKRGLGLFEKHWAAVAAFNRAAVAVVVGTAIVGCSPSGEQTNQVGSTEADAPGSLPPPAPLPTQAEKKAYKALRLQMIVLMSTCKIYELRGINYPEGANFCKNASLSITGDGNYAPIDDNYAAIQSADVVHKLKDAARSCATALFERGDAYEKIATYQIGQAENAPQFLDPQYVKNDYSNAADDTTKCEAQLDRVGYDAHLETPPAADAASPTSVNTRSAVTRNSPPFESASFNCAKARSSAEITICHDPELAQLDRQLSGQYRDALLRDTDGRVRAAQRAALREREACTTRQCLMSWYAARAAALQ